MIILAQRARSENHMESLVLKQAEDWNAWETGVIVWNPKAGSMMDTADQEQCRFLGAGDLYSELRAAVAEVARWSSDTAPAPTALGTFTASMGVFLEQMDAAIKRAFPEVV